MMGVGGGNVYGGVGIEKLKDEGIDDGVDKDDKDDRLLRPDVSLKVAGRSRKGGEGVVSNRSLNTVVAGVLSLGN
jgi:hypothetical protein